MDDTDSSSDEDEWAAACEKASQSNAAWKESPERTFEEFMQLIHDLTAMPRDNQEEHTILEHDFSPQLLDQILGAEGNTLKRILRGMGCTTYKELANSFLVGSFTPAQLAVCKKYAERTPYLFDYTDHLDQLGITFDKFCECVTILNTK